MTKIGKLNTLKVLRVVDFGVYLDGNELGDILLPSRYVPENSEVGNEIEVFIYCDSDDELIATTEKPKAMVGEIALLPVRNINFVGAFLDWGLSKDLLVPFDEQLKRMEEGEQYVVYIYQEPGHIRLAASSKLENFLNKSRPEYAVGEEVDLLIYDESELGFKAVINDTHTGLIYHDDIYKRVDIGDKLKGFVRQVRDDGKIDLSFQKPGYQKSDSLSETILAKLKEKGGFLSIGDKSEPEVIYEMFSVSKKKYKQALGDLYKKRKIVFVKNGIAETPEGGAASTSESNKKTPKDTSLTKPKKTSKKASQKTPQKTPKPKKNK